MIRKELPIDLQLYKTDDTLTSLSSKGGASFEIDKSKSISGSLGIYIFFSSLSSSTVSVSFEVSSDKSAWTDLDQKFWSYEVKDKITNSMAEAQDKMAYKFHYLGIDNKHIRPKYEITGTAAGKATVVWIEGLSKNVVVKEKSST